MKCNDLASMHALLDDVVVDRGSVWHRTGRAPEWAHAPSTVVVGNVSCGDRQVCVFVGPWIGYRLLTCDPTGWRFARVMPTRRRRPVRSAGLAHRFATADSGLRRG